MHYQRKIFLLLGGESRFVDAELDIGTKLDATKVPVWSLSATVRAKFSDDVWMTAARSSPATRGSLAAAHVELVGDA